ncbi:uncharacterized protein LOC125646902 [Ostrea edulis]|uniref:uncharacterized protein LOC125646902 n=1 Tax=Ostrea edulis TaxID=37623 RepID=UPI0024AEFE32|nr:uncharacterized protein LOC125646902 [Ostrea edulis]XP_048729459.2 uncharacterized protein LOC125646902 [Ostrea edulis]
MTMLRDCWKVYIIIVMVKFCTCVRNCALYQFWNKSAEECQPCSHCKLPQIIGTPCTNDSDVVCMGLKHLNFSFLGDASPMVTPRLPFQKDLLYMEGGNDTWRLLAYILIGVLCVLVVTVIVSLLLSWHCINKRKAAINRIYVEGEGEYVVMCRLPDVVSHPPPTEILPGSPPLSPQRRSSRRSRFYRSHRIYRPQRRLMNEYVDDVFESEDSGGSRSIRIPLHTIPEDS